MDFCLVWFKFGLSINLLKSGEFMDKLNRRKLFKLGAYTIASLPLFKTIKAFAAKKLGLDARPVAPTDAKVKKEVSTRR